MSQIEYIRQKLPEGEILAQLAEECNELAHAALKLRRVLDGTNPTPITEEEALRGLHEEVGDVLLCMVVAGVGLPFVKQCPFDGKLERWAARLKEENDG